MRKKPSCVKASRDSAEYIASLPKDSYLFKIVNDGLDILAENMFAGQLIEKKKFPKIYVQKYGVNNLYKYNLDSGTRLVYTLVSDGSGVELIVLEIMGHKAYEERFGYK